MEGLGDGVRKKGNRQETKLKLLYSSLLSACLEAFVQCLNYSVLLSSL